MQPLSAEWVQKAEGDFATATRELRARKAPNFDAVSCLPSPCGNRFAWTLRR